MSSEPDQGPAASTGWLIPVRHGMTPDVGPKDPPGRDQ